MDDDDDIDDLNSYLPDYLRVGSDKAKTFERHRPSLDPDLPRDKFKEDEVKKMLQGLGTSKKMKVEIDDSKGKWDPEAWSKNEFNQLILFLMLMAVPIVYTIKYSLYFMRHRDAYQESFHFAWKTWKATFYHGIKRTVKKIFRRTKNKVESVKSLLHIGSGAEDDKESLLYGSKSLESLSSRRSSSTTSLGRKKSLTRAKSLPKVGKRKSLTKSPSITQVGKKSSGNLQRKSLTRKGSSPSVGRGKSSTKVGKRKSSTTKVGRRKSSTTRVGKRKSTTG